jgi:hypothetical protein
MRGASAAFVGLLSAAIGPDMVTPFCCESGHVPVNDDLENSADVGFRSCLAAGRLEIAFWEALLKSQLQSTRQYHIARRTIVITRRMIVCCAVALYGLLLFLAFDYGYSTYIVRKDWPRVRDETFDHGLKANFDGYVRFGEFRYRFFTNSLGFRDASVREVPLKTDRRRVLLIGDSFTEGMAISFQQSFAGLLAAAGAERRDPVEFLDAGVISYSPTIYLSKIKAFLQRGLQLDEVVVFSDTSDVFDEATRYFCIDEHPEYRKFCRTNSDDDWFDAGTDLAGHFVVTDSLRMIIKNQLRALSGDQAAKVGSFNQWAGLDDSWLQRRQ